MERTDQTFSFTTEPKFPEILNEKRPALICGDGAEVKVMEAVVVRRSWLWYRWRIHLMM